MKIAVLSDIHGNYKALKKVEEDYKSLGIDKVIILGDLLCRGEQPVEVIKEIESIKPIVLIKGNSDDWLQEVDELFVPETKIQHIMKEAVEYTKSIVDQDQIDKILNLPSQYQIEIENKKILCVHGSDRLSTEQIGIDTDFADIEALIERMDYDILLCGHTHYPLIFFYKEKIVMNVGSVGRPMDEKKASYGILEISQDTMQYSIRKVIF